MDVWTETVGIHRVLLATRFVEAQIHNFIAHSTAPRFTSITSQDGQIYALYKNPRKGE